MNQADLSYSYWAANAVTGAAPAPQAKLLTEEELSQQDQLQTAAPGASAWNAAGTFEERNLTAWAQDRVRQLLTDAEGSSEGGVVARVTEIVSCTGDACQWVVRGKRRAGFELAIDFKWAASVEGTDVSGTAKLPNACCDELDELDLADISVTLPEGADESAKAAATAAAQALLPALQSALQELTTLLRNYGL